MAESWVGSRRPGAVRSEAKMRVLAVMTSEGSGGGGLREEMRVWSHVCEGGGRWCGWRAARSWAARVVLLALLIV